MGELKLKVRLWWIKRREALVCLAARLIPAPVRVQVVVNAFVAASDPRSGGPRRGGYAGPEGLTYRDAYEGAGRTRRELRARRARREAHRVVA